MPPKAFHAFENGKNQKKQHNCTKQQQCTAHAEARSECAVLF
jgi:hypothetical protein